MSPQTTDLYTALQWHLPWHKARVKFIAAFVLALIQVTTVKPGSHRQRLEWNRR